MAFVKLDCGMLDSTIWFDRESREVFITALLMAEPREFSRQQPQFEVTSTDPTGWVVPTGWFGYVPASSEGIIRRCGIDKDIGMIALTKLGAPDPYSRTPDYEGRRLVRVAGGFIVLNFMRYRDRDYTGAERQKRWRDRKRASTVTPLHNNDVTSVTQAEAEAEAEADKKSTFLPKVGLKSNLCELIYKQYPRRVGKKAALLKIAKAINSYGFDKIDGAVKKLAELWKNEVDFQFLAHPAAWFHQERFNDDPETWKPHSHLKPNERNAAMGVNASDVGRKTQEFLARKAAAKVQLELGGAQ